jgi:hypothetical protein
MSDDPAAASEPTPPPRVFRVKQLEFERANPGPHSPPSPAPALVPDPGIPAADSGRIDVRDLINAGAGADLQPGAHAAKNRPNEVHAILHHNLRRDIAAGHFDLGVLDDSKRLRRIRDYWMAMAAVNVPLGVFAYRVGHEMALPFVCAIALMAFFSAGLTWKTFFLRTRY